MTAPQLLGAPPGTAIASLGLTTRPAIEALAAGLIEEAERDGLTMPAMTAATLLSLLARAEAR